MLLLRWRPLLPHPLRMKMTSDSLFTLGSRHLQFQEMVWALHSGIHGDHRVSPKSQCASPVEKDENY